MIHPKDAKCHQKIGVSFEALSYPISKSPGTEQATDGTHLLHQTWRLAKAEVGKRCLKGCFGKCSIKTRGVGQGLTCITVGERDGESIDMCV